MDSKVLAAIAGAALAASLGAFLGGIGYFLKSRAEMLRTKRQVLFYLLETRHIVKTLLIDPKDIMKEVNKYSTSFLKKKGLDIPSTIDNKLAPIIEQIISNNIAAIRPKIDEKFVDSFEEALTELSKTHPILAFRLKGNQKVEEFLNSQKEHLNQLGQLTVADPAPEYMTNFRERQLNVVNKYITNDLLDDLNYDIQIVSMSCSFYTWFICKRIIKSNKLPNFTVFLESYFEESFDEILNVLRNLKQDEASTSEADIEDK